MNNKAVEISVIFSFRNEQENIPALIERSRSALESCTESFEIIFVNDDSTDTSLDLLKAHHEQDPRIKVVNMSRRFGVTECVIAGLKYSSGEAIVFLDADLQDPPEVIPQLVEEWRGGADVVHTVRKKRKGESKARVILTSLAYRLINLSSDLELPVDAGDFKLLSRRVVDHLLNMKDSRPYIRGLIAWVGFRQTFVEYVRDARQAGDSHFRFYGISAIFQFFNGITAFSALPIYLVLISGVVLFIIAVALGIAALFVSGPAIGAMPAFTLIGFLILIWSSILMALGVIGLYVSRIDQNVRNRPRFIVKDVLGIEEEVDRSDY